MKKVISIMLSVAVVCLMFTACASNKKEEVIDVRQAQRLIQSYTAEELGLTEEQMHGAKFLRGDQTQELDGVKYYEILVANTIETGDTDSEGNKLYSIQNIGVYYVTLDGENAYSVNKETNELTKLVKKEVPTLSPEEVSELSTQTDKK